MSQGLLTRGDWLPGKVWGSVSPARRASPPSADSPLIALENKQTKKAKLSLRTAAAWGYRSLYRVQGMWGGKRPKDYTTGSVLPYSP